MSEWFESLEGTLAFSWHALSRVNTDHTAPNRLATLATCGDRPEARMVVLRMVDPKRRILEIHSDTEAGKVSELRAHPEATVLCWSAEDDLQLRLRCRFAILTGNTVDPQWARIHDGARRAYGGRPAPGTPMDDPLAYENTPERTRFAVLRGTVGEIETLHLGRPHRRARFPLGADGLSDHWIAP